MKYTLLRGFVKKNFADFSTHTGRRSKDVLPCKEVPLGALLILDHLGGFYGQKPPEKGNSIIKKTVSNSKMARDRAKVAIEHLQETGAGRSESTVILVTMAMGLGERLHRSRQRVVQNNTN